MKRQRSSERHFEQKRCGGGGSCYSAILLLAILSVLSPPEAVEARIKQRSSSFLSMPPFVVRDAPEIALVSSIRRKWRTAASVDSERLLILRGGDDGLPSDDGSDEVEADDTQEALSNDEEKERDDGENSQRPSRWTTFSSLFDLNSDIQAEACEEAANSNSLENENDDATTNDDGENDPPFFGHARTKTNISSNTGRGGALVKEKARNRFLFLPPLDTSRVAPTASRLIQDSDYEHDDDADGENESDTAAAVDAKQSSSTASRITASVMASAKSVKKVWWVNAWADQLPDDDDEDVVEEQIEIQDAELDELDEDEEEEIAEEEQVFSNDGKVVKVEESADEDVNVMNETFQSETNRRTRRRLKAKAKRELDAESQEKEDSIVEPAQAELVKSSVDENENLESIGQNASATNEPTFQATIALPPAVNASTIVPPRPEPATPYTSSGYWQSIDKVLTMGYADKHPEWRLSSRLRTVRKAAAKVTGMHGVLSGKPRSASQSEKSNVDEEQLGLVRRRLQAIDRARKNVERAAAIAANSTKTRRRLFKRRGRRDAEAEYEFVLKKSSAEEQEEKLRLERVKAIDKQMQAAQRQLMELACEKDVLQRRHNPLWNYTTDSAAVSSKKETTSDSALLLEVTASRKFNFPPKDLVDEYLDMLFYSGRLDKLNHTDLWRNGNYDDDDDDDELALPTSREEDRKRRNGNGNSGSWLLRNGIGEKIGETVERSTYKAVCHSLMGVVARGLSALHGLNVMSYSDIRLSTEHAPDLPPIGPGIIPGSGSTNNYAREAIHDAMLRGAKKKKRSAAQRGTFIQRDAVVETLTSQCQIAAPLMRLFPLAWQRAMLANIITLVTAVLADFCEGIEFQILGHRLTFAFTPITEEDMIQGMIRGSFNNPRRTNPEEFEAAVRATAEDLAENLKFLDRWHERALGGGLLRTQIATLIARVVLTLVDDILGESRMDLWAAAGGPRLVAGLEYRTTTTYNKG